MSEFVAAFDLGGTDLKSALVDDRGAVTAFARRPSRVTDSAGAPVGVMRAAMADLRAAAAGQPLLALGAGVPGVINPELRRMIGATANLPHWEDFAIGEALDLVAGLPVALDNDANLAALAEHRMGAARGAALSLTVTIGTGVGCGIVERGRILRGAFGGAGEIGHLPLGGGLLACACEVEGCVEPDMCGSGLLRAAGLLGLNAASAEDVFALAAKGDAESRRLIDRFADRLGATLAIAINLLNPDCVVIGGGVSQAGDALLMPLRAAVRRYALASHRRDLRIIGAALGERAGVVGAGLLAWDRVNASGAGRSAQPI